MGHGYPADLEPNKPIRGRTDSLPVETITTK